MRGMFATAASAVVVSGTALGFAAGASVLETADRLERRQVVDTLAPPTAREVCNSLTYVAYNALPVVQCYRAVTAERGWHVSTIDAWQAWLITDPWSVTQGESSQCPNLRGGDRIVAGENCLNKRSDPSPGSDTGFGQVTSIWYGHGDYLCERGYCGWQSIVASPFDSMVASVVLPVEMGRPWGGSDPWCRFAQWAFEYHRCERAPDR